MTLILSLATLDFVLQVSDRRLSGWHNNTLQVIENQNKSVLFCNRMSFAYTGLADIGGTSADNYLVDVIAQCPTQDLGAVANEIAKQATDTFSRIRHPGWMKRHAFTGVGFTRGVNDERHYPMLLRISNYHASGQIDGLPEANDRFTVTFSVFGRPGQPPWSWLSTGMPLLPKEVDDLHKGLKRCSRKNTGPEPPTRLLVDMIRRVSRRERGVGADVLVSMIPLGAACSSSIVAMTPDGNGMVMGTGSPYDLAKAFKLENRMVFNYMPGNGAKPQQHGPALVCPGHGTSISSFKSGPLVR